MPPDLQERREKKGTITVYPPTSACANVQEKIVCKIDKFRFSPSFGGCYSFDAGSDGDMYFTAAGRADYDDATHPCIVVFRYNFNSNNLFNFVLQDAGGDS